jgi:hypothetical protein
VWSPADTERLTVATVDDAQWPPSSLPASPSPNVVEGELVPSENLPIAQCGCSPEC